MLESTAHEVARIDAELETCPAVAHLGHHGPDGAVGMKLWHHTKAVVVKHVVEPHKKPHHYVTATLLTGALKVIGHLSMEAAVVAYVYAFCETIVTGAEGRHDEESKHWEQHHRRKRHHKKRTDGAAVDTINTVTTLGDNNAEVREGQVAD